MKWVKSLKNMKRICLLIIWIVGFTVGISGQAKKDSLWRVWNDPAAVDSNRLKAIQALTWPMLNVNLDSAYLLANMQLDHARQKGDKKWIAKALYNIATYYYLKSDYVRSLSFYQQSLDLRKEIGDLKGEAAIYGNFGLIYGQQGDKIKDLEYQLKSLAINEKLRDTSGMTSNYNNLAIIYQEQDDSTKALEYYNLSLKMYEANNQQQHLALVYNNIGNLYRKYKQFDKALAYLNKSLEMRTALNDRLGMAINYVNLGTAYLKMKDYKRAKENTLLSIEYFKAYGDTSSLANSYFNLGDIALHEEKYAEAVKWCKKSLEIAYEANKVPIQQADCSCLHRAYKGLGNYKMALDYFEEFYFLEDSLKDEDLKIEMNRLEFQKALLTDSLSREEEKNVMKMSHALEMNQRRRVTNVILIIGLGTLALALVFMSRMLYFQRKSESLNVKTQELEKQQLVNEISLLKTQVNPHFLFNSLSILSSLVRVDPDLSERFIEQLSRSYRYILEQKDQSLVTLRTELGFIESYSFLLKIRFENKFNLKIDLPEEILDKYKIAPLTLQLLVENAVKHNRMSVTEPLIVHISLDEQNRLVVRNKLQPRSTPSNSTGVGLQNIMNRYALLTKRQVWAGETEDQFMVKIPLLNEAI
jgi:tetratricopeptide (TPR) repeat protein